MDVQTLVFGQAVLSFLQVLALFTQHPARRAHNALRWWTFANLSFFLGGAFGALRSFPSLRLFAIAMFVPLTLAGRLMLHVGVLRFFERKQAIAPPVALCAAAILVHLYFTVARDGLSARDVNFAIFPAVISFLTFRVFLV